MDAESLVGVIHPWVKANKLHVLSFTMLNKYRKCKNPIDHWIPSNVFLQVTNTGSGGGDKKKNVHTLIQPNEL